MACAQVSMEAARKKELEFFNGEEAYKDLPNKGASRILGFLVFFLLQKTLNPAQQGCVKAAAVGTMALLLYRTAHTDG